MRDKLKGRQKSETAQLEVELEELEKQMQSLDSGSFKAELENKEASWQNLRQRRIAFNAMLVDALLLAIHDTEETVRSAALRALVTLSSRGNMKVLDAMLEYLTKNYQSNSASASCVHLLGQTSPIAHTEGVAMAVKYLGFSDSTGVEAFQALRQIVERGDVVSLQGVLEHMEKGDMQAKELAAAAVPLIASVGDDVALGKVRRLVSHRSRDVRVAAVKTLVSLCPPASGDKRVIPALIMCLQSDADELVRIEALDALSKCAKPNDSSTLTALVNCVTDSNALIQQRAPLLLSRLCFLQTDVDDSALVEQATAAEAAAAAVRAASDKKNASILDPERKALALKAAEREAKKAGEEAGARALANAHLEKRQLRDVQLSHVSKSLMTHARCSDKPVRGAALKAMAVLVEMLKSQLLMTPVVIIN